MAKEWETVIGLEVHVQLKTESKMFTRAVYRYGEPPNTLTNPVVMGLPGTLPVMNERAIEQTIRVGLLFDCEIAETCKWDRKNYFYPDNPKNYQISQYDQPLCAGGSVEIELPGPSRNVQGEHRQIGLTRIHLEEDVGKLTHYENDSLVDYNRAGAPLIEIVSEPDLRGADEAFAYLTALRMDLQAAGISDCDMEKGQLRCDANVSIREKGDPKLGVKIEIKNMNTISGVRDGISYEMQRQFAAVEAGETLVQETRRWNPEGKFTSSMRSKEMAHDYRYFPDPDLMPVKIGREQVNKLRETLPERPFDKQRRYTKDYGLPFTVTSVICYDHRLASFFEEALAIHNEPKKIANYIANDLLRELSAAEGEGAMPLEESLITPRLIAGLAKLVDNGGISSQIAKDVFVEMFKTGKPAEQIVEEKGLKQSSDAGELEGICQQVIDDNPKPAKQFQEGKEGAINALKGQVMKATRGQANPRMVDEILRRLLGK